MLICHCFSVSDREVRSAVRAGARTRRLVAESCGAGDGCGGCSPAIEQIISQEAAPPGGGARMAGVSGVSSPREQRAP